MKCPHCQGELSQGDVQRAVGLEAEQLAQGYANRENAPLRTRILADVKDRAERQRGLNRKLWEMARRFEDYESVYDCARELRELCKSMSSFRKRPRALTWKEKLAAKDKQGT